jgi:hypothetical protein
MMASTVEAKELNTHGIPVSDVPSLSVLRACVLFVLSSRDDRHHHIRIASGEPTYRIN